MTRRLVVSAVALVVVIFAAVGIPFLHTVDRYERERLRLDLVRDAVVIGATVQDRLAEAHQPDPVTNAVARKYADTTGARVVIIDRNGTVRADSSASDEGDTDAGPRSMASRPEYREALAGSFAAVTRNSVTLGYKSLYVAVPVSSVGKLLGAVRVSFPTTVIDRRIAVQRTRLLFLGVLMATIVAFLGAWLARWVAQPIAALRQTTRTFGMGNLQARAQTTQGPEDIRQLGGEFNTMAERLHDLVLTQHAFVADASHELRSPLTAIRLQLEAMEYGDDVTRDERRVRAIEEVNRLARNVDGLLVLARQDTADAVTTEVDLSLVASQRAEFWQPLMHERGIGLETNCAPSLLAHVSPDRVGTVLDNLISNALDAAPVGSVLTVSAQQSEGNVTIHVIDRGRGMEPEQRVAAFDRFWRESSNRTALGGSGLGLAIARKLVAADRGTIRLDGATPHGIDAVITYPRTSTKAAR
jgi:signal transduction histidine kinase